MWLAAACVRVGGHLAGRDPGVGLLLRVLGLLRQPALAVQGLGAGVAARVGAAVLRALRQHPRAGDLCQWGDGEIQLRPFVPAGW